MFAFIYIFLCVMIGREMTEHFLLRRIRESSGNCFWLLFPMAFGSGTLILTWLVYGISYMNAVVGKSTDPLLLGNLIVMVGSVLYLGFLYLKRKRTGKIMIRKDWINDRRIFRKEFLFFSVLFLCVAGMMFYVFFISNGFLRVGFTVFSDYAPHTSMIRSFSWGGNFPTQYPHFGGEDVKYHFMFQFLTGNLEYLGLRIDYAYNVISAVSMWSFLVMLYKLVGRIMGGTLTGALTVLFFFFRSGTAFFRFAWEHIKAGNLLETLIENTTFIGYTPNENWGLWCFNVYLNQRHLAFGFLIVSIALWVFLDWLEDGDSHSEKGGYWLLERLYAKESWASKDLSTAVFIGILLGLTAFWNGAAVIGGLLILAGFAVFSDGKVDYAVMAFLTVLLSALQSRFFMDGSAIEFSFYWGLLAEDRSITGVLWFLIQLTGIYFLGLLLISVFLTRLQRSALIAFILPLIFAFTISLTPDIAVNHKYVMLSYVFVAMFWSYTLVSIWRTGRGMQIVSVLTALCLFATGVYDFVIIMKDNDAYHRILIDMRADVTDWLKENLTSQDLILTPEYAINEVTMSGAMLYCGWPYYAWSAGYDTQYREVLGTEIYTSEEQEYVRTLVEQEGISYILYESGMTFNDKECQEETISALYDMVYETIDGRIRIYKVSEFV